MERVCHFEVPYSDKSRFESFYGKVFGWQIAPAPVDMPYSFIFTTEVDENFMPKQTGGSTAVPIRAEMKVALVLL